MQIAVDYYNNFKYDKFISEYSILFKGETSSLDALYNFAEFAIANFPQTRINIVWVGAHPLSILDIIKDMRKTVPINCIATIPFYSIFEEVDYCKNSGVPYMASDQCTSWEMLHAMLEAGCSQIKIGGELGFELPLVHKTIKQYNPEVKVRVVPNKVGPLTQKDCNAFFIRPEDIGTYEPYIDVLNIYNSTNTPNIKEDFYIIYEAYMEHRSWPSDLSYLVSGLEEGLFIGDGLPPQLFGESRLSCGKRCLKYPGRVKCSLCWMFGALSTKLTSHNIAFITEEDI